MAIYEPHFDHIYRGMNSTLNWSVDDSADADRDYTSASGNAIFYPSDPNDLALNFTKAMTLDATPATNPQIICVLVPADTATLQAAQWITVKCTVTLANGTKDTFAAKFQLLKETGA